MSEHSVENKLKIVVAVCSKSEGKKNARTPIYFDGECVV